MTNFTATILGIDPKRIEQLPMASQLKLTTSAQLLLIPVGLWFMSGFLLAWSLAGCNLFVSLLVGAFCASLIFVIDRSLTTSFNTTGKSLFWIRILTALLSGLLGSIALDTALFNADIDAYQIKQAAQEFHEKNDLRKAVKQAELDLAITYQHLTEKSFHDEMNGNGSGRVGYGKIAAKKELTAWDARTQKELLHSELKLLGDSAEVRASKYAATILANEEGAVLKKIHDFHIFVCSDSLNFFVYGLFFSCLLLFETMLILYKHGAAKTYFEHALEQEEFSRLQQLQAIRLNREKYLQAVNQLGAERVLEIEKLTLN